ncbi:NusG domain II-containing protein [Paraclostridium ghonii]|uniref:NusG domain II-containing protein n=1 Tax=Paraclostridium ghonii TaxID=29358 RepID=UPI00202CFB67|nr:NusG domain II-containing protein [Paeniclostridium ghonii]MCM0165233.1 NusG domain II-containing protein [Paeniclostridium ghonii]
MKKNDFFLLLSILIIIGMWMGFNFLKGLDEGEKIIIYLDNKVYKEVSIDDTEEIIIKTDSGFNKIKIHDRGVEVIDASCPDKVCVKTGFIDKSNKNIVCIPNKVSIKIMSNEKNDIDTIAN